MLCPRQREAFDQLLRSLERRPAGVRVLVSVDGAGRTTLLEALHRERGGVLLGSEHFVEAVRSGHPLAVEEGFESLVRQALDRDDLVILDDVHHVTDLGDMCSAYPRSGWITAALAALAGYAEGAGKSIVLGADGTLPAPVGRRGFHTRIDDFEAADYAFLCRAFLGDGTAARVDYDKVFRFAPHLNAWLLRAACISIAGRSGDCTEPMLDYLRSMMGSNVDLDEVRDVDLSTLKGVDDVLESLEVNVILPLENDGLATRYDLKPKRGVLLVGPPGTGKTTIGRALAHRLKSKFLMVDGTFIAGTGQFYQRIHDVFETAKQNAPAVVFIDDSDAIFESGEELGLYRYLLTMLDGLESRGSGRVCVMMTAMDVGNLPPALVRSGRIELWLEMKLPDQAARREILRELAARLPEDLRDLDGDRLAAATEGFTGADLERLVDDGKALHAWRVSRGEEAADATSCFLEAIETVRRNKERYAEADDRARRQRSGRAAFFDVERPDSPD